MFISLAFVCFLFSLQEPDNLSSEIEVHEETRPSESSQAASSQMHLVHSARMHACTRMHACMHAHTHARMHACTRTHTHTHTHAHTRQREREKRESYISSGLCNSYYYHRFSFFVITANNHKHNQNKTNTKIHTRLFKYIKKTFYYKQSSLALNRLPWTLSQRS